MKGLDRQLEYERVACEAAEDFMRKTEPLFAEIYEGAEFDARWEVVWLALKRLGKALARADFALPKGFVRRPDPKRRSSAVALWATVAKDGTVVETYFDIADAIEGALDDGFRVVLHLEESGRSVAEIAASQLDQRAKTQDSRLAAFHAFACDLLEGEFISERGRLTDAGEARVRSLLCGVDPDVDLIANVAMGIAFDRERENEHNRTHAECAFCRKETGRTPAAMVTHARGCELHPMRALLEAAEAVRDGEMGAIPLAAMVLLNEALIEVGKAA